MPKNWHKNWAWLSVFIFFLLLLNSIFLINKLIEIKEINYSFTWFSLAFNLNFLAGLRINISTAIMLFVVQFIALLVFIYSIEYKKNDEHFHRFFAYIGLFIFAINGLVLSNNLLIIFIFWEFVGFASYLLIGFWFDKQKAIEANFKAFMTNRFADIFLLIGVLLLWSNVGTLQLDEIKNYVSFYGNNNECISLAGFCIFLGCMGKSAQFPFQVWLPDAMEGPTPVSALIHAATMVAAGVFLMMNVIFLCSPLVLNLIAFVGCLTALLGAISALSQYDLKKILAFSTISQLGIMMAAIGLNAPELAFFHLFTHAFFKAGLFLSAGSVIHCMHHAHEKLPTLSTKYYFDKQDIRNMGGLLKIIPTTSICFIICGLALIGLPFFSGFVSKGNIITKSYELAQNGSFFDYFIWISLLITTFLTSFYVFKTILKAFFGELKISNLLKENNINFHDNGKLILVPIIILAFCSFQFNPFVFGVKNLLFSSLQINLNLEIKSEIVTVLISFLAIIIVYILYVKNKIKNIKIPVLIFKISYRHFYLDAFVNHAFIRPNQMIMNGVLFFETSILEQTTKLIYVSQVVAANVIAFIDRFFVDGIVNFITSIVNGFSYIIKYIQNGKIQFYILFFIIFITLFIMIIFFN
ncbi:MAG: NADH-quinone oxidoreductase subunit L [Cytophagales bacterium]|nr:MAG: NADH-quinone oxidoreductase subunit L [Cytophagales bacterium]